MLIWYRSDGLHMFLSCRPAEDYMQDNQCGQTVGRKASRKGSIVAYLVDMSQRIALKIL